ncbi:PH domain-containing protein [Alishewanella tabrizica]|uniref:Membrane protein n=1 Tax=Alishewanella tabrizica TaxID=671278 RepID=A0ABQ2WUF8_9ALTE|nr:PH domain-containing protein [Alishewanella tabrizica]GGW72877.1 membrane protein [Alishewanella tabrizica]
MTTETFQNLPVSLAQLPSLDTLQWQTLAPSYTPLNVWLNVAITSSVALLWLALLWQPFWPLSTTLAPVVFWSGIVLCVLCAWSCLYCYFAYPLKAYALRQHDLSFQRGLFFKTSITQPITRIQHIELKRGPLERRFGLATLQVFSAGGAAHTFALPGLPVADAETIRQFILQHKDTVQYA